MNSILTSLLSYLLLYKYVALSIIAASSSFLLPLPENSIFLATGAFAGQGYFSLAGAFAISLVSGVIGDCVGYILTKKWGYKIIKEERVRKYKFINKLDAYIRDHAGLTIFFTRFVGTLGPAVNFLSGLAGVSFKRFLFFDIIGNACDIGLFLVAGYVLGNFWQNFSGIGDTVSWIALVIGLLFVIIRSIFWKTKPSSKTS